MKRDSGILLGHLHRLGPITTSSNEKLLLIILVFVSLAFCIVQVSIT